MFPSEAWIIVAVVVAIALAVYPFLRNYRVKRRLVCPRHHKEVDVELECTGGSRKKDTPLEVKSCSVFDNPREVHCDQECLEGMTPWERPEGKKEAVSTTTD